MSNQEKPTLRPFNGKEYFLKRPPGIHALTPEEAKEVMIKTLAEMGMEMPPPAEPNVLKRTLPTQEDDVAFEPVCPKCGEPCDHTPNEMQGFAMQAAEEASDWLRRIEKGEV